MMLTELLELIADTAEKNCSLGTEISLEELPADGGIYAELGEGFTESVSYNKQEVKMIPVLRPLILWQNWKRKAGINLKN